MKPNPEPIVRAINVLRLNGSASVQCENARLIPKDRPGVLGSDEVVATLLRENVLAVTRPDRPAGCLSIQGGTACATDSAPIAGFLAASRLAGERALADRLGRAVDDGDLPAHADPVALARFVMIVTEGHAVHAAAGVGREDLRKAAEIALAGFAAASGARLPDPV